MITEQHFEDKKYIVIYIFQILLEDKRYDGCLKIGKTTVDLGGRDPFSVEPNEEILNKVAHSRIDEYSRTNNIPYELLHTDVAIFRNKEGKILAFDDHDVHAVLENSGIKHKVFKGVEKHGKEWFEVNLETAITAINAVKKDQWSLLPGEISNKKPPIKLRPSQREAVDDCKKQFRKGHKFLWNAKMRFGKTIASLQLIKELKYDRTLILTHRPVVNDDWQGDFNKVFQDNEDYRFGDKNSVEFSKLIKLNKEDKHIIYFVSMQDLRGSDTVGGNFDKNHEIFSTVWDLLIVDEVHEGTQTALGQEVLKLLLKDKTHTLSLSGTPYNVMPNYKPEEIYSWDYIKEQQAKRDWDIENFGDSNPYAEMPKMNIYTYNLGALLKDFADEDLAFNFREFFRVNNEDEFVHKKDVLSFLNLLTETDEEAAFPFCNTRYRNIFRHTLWVLPGVKAARVLSKMLQEHEVFGKFNIANVAGDGDEETASGKAKELVYEAITDDPDNAYSITLTCGRLTTGVTIKEWTGVLMLSGGYSTSAASYMQTIFRVQSPCTINGRMKDNAYVFDFAPDRTLKVLATVADYNKPSKTVSADVHTRLREFINFCPIIAYAGGKPERIDENKLFGHLRRAYIEKVVRSGFENSYIYDSHLLMNLSQADLSVLDGMKGIIGQTKAIGIGDININDQGFDEEKYDTNDSSASSSPILPKKDSDEVKRKKQKRAEAISILRGISIRMPLMIYGANINDDKENEELTIDNFTVLVDDSSWIEFMPPGVTKEKFEEIKKFYDPQIFAEAGKYIRSLVKVADSENYTIEERIERIATIFSTFRNPDKETVLTPWRVVNLHMGDTLGGYSFYDEHYQEPITEERYVDRGKITDEVFSTDTRLLEINSKSGLYPLYLTYNVYRRRLKDMVRSAESFSDNQKVWDQVVSENIFIVCKTPMARSITERTLVGFRDVRVNAHYWEDLTQKIKQDPRAFVEEVNKLWNAKLNNMKFNAVVGNPPYQEEGISTRKSPVYHLFYDIAFQLSDKVSLISPGRFLYRAGQTPEDWMDKILNDPHFKVVDYFVKSIEVFPSVDIKGGIAITYRDANEDFGPIGFFSEYQELRSILQKVSSHKDFKKGAFTDIVSSRGQYKFSDLLFEKHPYVKDVQGKGTGAQIASNSLENLPKVFFEQKPNDGKDYIQIYGREGNKRVIKWIRRDFVIPIDTLDIYKVFVPEANGTGAIGEVLSTPVIGQPVIGHTDTFLSIGKFETEFEAIACLKYVKSKFCRCMLGTLKATQHNPRDTWSNVPLQSFTSSSDIDWSVSVEGIDQQLYKKYELSSEEIEFIERMIKAM